MLLEILLLPIETTDMLLKEAPAWSTITSNKSFDIAFLFTFPSLINTVLLVVAGSFLYSSPPATTMAGESIGTNLGIVSFKKFNFSGENPHELTLPKKGKMYRVTVYSTSLYHKFGLFYCIFQSNVARAVHKIFSSSLTLELNGETGVITITNAMNCIVFVEELA